jgi:hypothetical protein
MQAAYNGAERKVSYKTANKIAARYHDSVRITKLGFGARPLVVPAVGIALAALVLLGFVYPKVCSDWVRHHTGGPIEQTGGVPSQVFDGHSGSATQPERVDPAFHAAVR